MTDSDQDADGIRIALNLRGEKRLKGLIHEMVHTTGSHIDETFVEQLASDTARALWRQGYREGSCDADPRECW